MALRLSWKIYPTNLVSSFVTFVVEDLDYFMLSHQLNAGRIWTEGPGFRADHRMKLMYIQLSASGRQARYVRKLAQGSEGRQERIPFKAIRGDPAFAHQYAADTDASYRMLFNTGLHPAGTETHERSALENRWYNMRKATTAAAEKIVPPAQEQRASGYPPWANVASAERKKKREELLDQRLVQGVSPAEEVTRLNNEVRRITQERLRQDKADMNDYKLTKRTAAESIMALRRARISLRLSWKISPTRRRSDNYMVQIAPVAPRPSGKKSGGPRLLCRRTSLRNMRAVFCRA